MPWECRDLAYTQSCFPLPFLEGLSVTCPLLPGALGSIQPPLYAPILLLLLPSPQVGDLVTLVQVERHIFYHPSLPLAGTCTQLHEGRVWVNSLRLVVQSKDVVTLSPTWQCHGSFSR